MNHSSAKTNTFLIEIGLGWLRFFDQVESLSDWGVVIRYWGLVNWGLDIGHFVETENFPLLCCTPERFFFPQIQSTNY